MRPPSAFSTPVEPTRQALGKRHPSDDGSPPARGLLATALFGLTLFTTTTLGSLWGRLETLDAMVWLSPAAIIETWTNPAHVLLGLQFSVPVCLILLAHELGHYFVCRWHRLRVQLPFFLPAPFGFGTFGAFIRIRQPILDRRVLFDVGISGPIAGFVTLLPFLLLGVLWSEPGVALPEDGEPRLVLGSSLAFYGAAVLIHGEIPAEGLLVHPFALAAWLGLLATMLNLLPIGQLDGGHIVYALFGKRQHRTAPVLWVLMLAAAVLFGWWGWAVWAVLIAFLGIRHPPTGDEHRPLDRRRNILGWVALAIFLLSFMPNPIGLSM